MVPLSRREVFQARGNPLWLGNKTTRFRAPAACQTLCASISGPYAWLGGEMPQLSAEKPGVPPKVTRTQEAGLRVSPGGVAPEACSFHGPTWSREKRQLWVGVLQGVGEPGQSRGRLSICCPGRAGSVPSAGGPEAPQRGEGGVPRHPGGERCGEEAGDRDFLGNSNSVQQKVGPMDITTSGPSSPVAVEINGHLSTNLQEGGQ